MSNGRLVARAGVLLLVAALAACQEQARQEIATTTEAVVGQDVEVVYRRLGLPAFSRANPDGSRLLAWNRRTIAGPSGSAGCDLIVMVGADRRVRSLQYSGPPAACRNLFPGLGAS